MACHCKGVVGLGLATMLFGCAATPPVPPGSTAELQLHAPCPADGGCAEPLSCVGGEDAREVATCELACNGSCVLPLQCMPRADGVRGGVCLPPPEHPHPWGT
jgi:hypothetical protein